MAPPPPRHFLPPHPHPRHKVSLLRYLFPHAVRARYRERLLGFHLDTLPAFKHRFQSRIYRFLVERQRRRRDESRLVDRARRLLLGPPPKPVVPRPPRGQHAAKPPRGKLGGKVGSMSSYLPGYGNGFGVSTGAGEYGAEGERERGGRRRKLAAIAGRVYNAGASAVSDLRESYHQSRTNSAESSEAARVTIPDSFPDVRIITKGNEQMVLFPSYAKRHVKGRMQDFDSPTGLPPSAVDMGEEEYWRHEWARHEDEKAIVDVDVRGWIYNPQRGPMTRRNRLLIGLARQLSGVPAPKVQQQSAEPSLASLHQQHEEEREQQRIAQKAKEIEQRGMGEKEIAQKGGYSEPPRDFDSEDEASGVYHRRRRSADRSGTMSPASAPGSPVLGGVRRSNTATSTELNEAELAVSNANMMARLGPFMTNPLVQLPITVFFYNDVTSQSRTVETNDSGHFILRAALDFVPTHVRVLANEDLSVTEPVQILEPKGVSLISDIDDTIKHSNITVGAKEIFRNTFVRDLGDLTVPGVKEWYGKLHDMGVSLHYCSNSPWQLFPVIASYFKMANLPPGSIHLKQYSGMLQGIFEPVAERKKGTLEKIMSDFPERKFLLVGDSGEADLEVYTDIAVSHPGRIAAIFIRDVTTPEQTGYFDSAPDASSSRNQRTGSAPKPGSLSRASSSDDVSRPMMPPRTASDRPRSMGPPMGDLIDFSEDPAAPVPLSETRHLADMRLDQVPQRPPDREGRKAPPPRPTKPTALQSSASSPALNTKKSGNLAGDKKPPPPPASRKPGSAAQHPLAQVQVSSPTALGQGQSIDDAMSAKGAVPPPPPPRRRGAPGMLSLSPHVMSAKRRSTPSLHELEIEDLEPLPPPGFPPRGHRRSPSGRSTYSLASPNGSPSGGPVNKKLDLWRRRLQRAQETLDEQGIALYTWRRGEDVIQEAVGIVNFSLAEMGLKDGRGKGGFGPLV